MMEFRNVRVFFWITCAVVTATGKTTMMTIPSRLYPSPSTLLNEKSETVTPPTVDTSSTDNVTESETMPSPIQETAPGLLIGVGVGSGILLLFFFCCFLCRTREETEPPGNDDIVSRKIEYGNITLSTDCYYEFDEKPKMVRFSATETDVDGTERGLPKFISIFDEGEEGNNSKGNNWYLKQDNDGAGNVQECVISVEINHNENSCAHDENEKLDTNTPCATNEDTEA